MNLVATLAMAQVIFLAGIDTSQDQVIKSGLNYNNNMLIIGPFIRGKQVASYIGRVLNKTRTFRINGTFRLK